MHVDEIAELLLRLPDLVRQQERRSIDFARSTSAWLSSLEQAFVANRLHQAGSIAMLRIRIVSAEQGELLTEHAFRGRSTRLRMLNAVASDSLQRATDIASAIVAENQTRITEAERIARQIVAVAVSRKLVIERAANTDNTAYLEDMRRGLVTNADLESAVAHLESLVGPQDALVLLDRALSPYITVLVTEPTALLATSDKAEGSGETKTWAQPA